MMLSKTPIFNELLIEYVLSSRDTGEDKRGFRTPEQRKP